METKKVKEYLFCLRCGRRLRKQEAKELGYGKICYEKMKKETRKKTLFKVKSIYK